jgi:hypothetical protein
MPFINKFIKKKYINKNINYIENIWLCWKLKFQRNLS